MRSGGSCACAQRRNGGGGGVPSASRPRPPPLGLRVGVGKPLIGRPGRLPRSLGGPRRKSPSAGRWNPEPRPSAVTHPARLGRRPWRWRR
ncbi:hypothetical protein NN561_015306 [Cricetulus griseus]